MAEDPELERRLAAMFASTRPRSGFEDELWRRIEARRPWHQRLGRRLQPALRFAPALATLLVVALGVTWLAGSLHGAGSAGSTTSAGAPAFGGQKAEAPAFGVLPRLRAAGGRSVTAPQASAGGADVNGASSFNGPLPSLPVTLPVYRYDEPSATERTTAAAALRAQTGVAVTVTPSDPVGGVEPRFQLSGPAAAGSQVPPLTTADAFLAAHGLTPRFAFQVSAAGSARQVVYGRLFVGAAGPIRQVRPDGTAAGLTVDLAGSAVSVSGPLDLPLASAPYPVRSVAEALSAAQISQGSGASALNRAELVYVLELSSGHGYYEPELLLTGPGGAVLAPVLAPAWLGA